MLIITTNSPSLAFPDSWLPNLLWKHKSWRNIDDDEPEPETNYDCVEGWEHQSWKIFYDKITNIIYNKTFKNYLDEADEELEK